MLCIVKGSEVCGLGLTHFPSARGSDGGTRLENSPWLARDSTLLVADIVINMILHVIDTLSVVECETWESVESFGRWKMAPESFTIVEVEGLLYRAGG